MNTYLRTLPHIGISVHTKRFTQVWPCSFYRDVSHGDSPEIVAREVFANSIQALTDTLEALDFAQYGAAVDALVNARVLAFLGLGNAAVIAREAHHKFLRVGSACHTAEDSDLQLMIVDAHLGPGNLLVAVSWSGESEPKLRLARVAAERGIRVLALTNFPRSSLARVADLVLLTAVFHGHLNGEIGSQRLAQLAVLESLYVNFLLRNGAGLADRLVAFNDTLGRNKTRNHQTRTPIIPTS